MIQPDAKLWCEVAQTIAQLEKLLDDDPRGTTPLLRAEGLRYLTRLIAGAIPQTIDGWDADYPTLIKMYTPYLQYGIPSPDCCYHTAAVHGDHVYRIYGKRGSSRLFDVETRSGHTADLKNFKRIDQRCDFEVDANGEIDILLSRERQPGNWLELPEGAGAVMVRQYYYDWLSEQPATLAIERVGATLPPPPLAPDAMSSRLELLMAWLRSMPAICRQGVEEYYGVDRSMLKFVPNPYAWADIEYGKGNYRCAPDEAVILELQPPIAPYWSVQLASHFWEALDWNLRQTSINGHQAMIDNDGMFRAVISHVDPGVPNWLDAGSHETGLITARYYRAEPTPPPRLRNVSLRELRRYLPDSTPEVSPQQRQDALRERARSVSRRRMGTE